MATTPQATFSQAEARHQALAERFVEMQSQVAKWEDTLTIIQRQMLNRTDFGRSLEFGRIPAVADSVQYNVPDNDATEVPVMVVPSPRSSAPPRQSPYSARESAPPEEARPLMVVPSP